MQLVVEKEGNLYTYTENFWTGKKELTFNGVALQKVNKKTFSINQNGVERYITVKGNFLFGITLVTDSGTIELVKNKWYEWVLILLPVLGVALGILGGAIGGFLSALFCMLGCIANATVLRSKKPVIFKILGCILIAVAVNFLWFLIYALIVGGIANAFPNIF